MSRPRIVRYIVLAHVRDTEAGLERSVSHIVAMIEAGLEKGGVSHTS